MHHKIAVLDNNLLIGDNCRIVTLKHPKNGEPAQFGFTQDFSAVFEVLTHQPDYGCWFIKDHANEDGSLVLVTRFDPVFLILPYLIKEHSVNPERFSPLDQLLDDVEFNQTRNLARCQDTNHLHLLTDYKDLEDFKVYKYNKAKTIGWLEKKVKRLADYLKISHVHVASGAQSSNFVRSKHEPVDEVDYIRYAFGIVSDYILPELAAELQDHMGIPKEVKLVSTEEPSSKKQKTEGCSGPLEDYSMNVPAEKKTVSQKLSAAQRKLAKVDKTGMKSITSFFSVKPKQP